MKEKIARGVAAGFALLLVLAYFLLPVSNDGSFANNSGRKKQELAAGESYSWPWTPQREGTNSLTLRLSGMKKAQEVTLFAELADEAGQTAASLAQPIAELGEEGDSVRLTGAFDPGRTYTLRVRTEGEGSLKLKGEMDEETGEFVPSMEESASFEVHNPVLLYFAAGALLAALTPVFGVSAVRRKQERSVWERALPWATFALIAGLGMVIALVRPMFAEDSPWRTWDEEIHYGMVQYADLFQDGGLSRVAGNMLTWNPGYAPLMVGYNLARIFTADAEILYRAGICCSAIVYAAFCALAVKHAPRFKATFLAAGTLPIMIFQMTSMTYDTVVTGSLLLGLAMTLESADRKERVSSLRAITLVSLLAFGTVAKPAYSLGLLFLFMIPADRLGGKGRAWAFRGFVLLMFAWVWISMVMPGAYDSVREGDSRFPGTSVSGQLAYMAANPVDGGLYPIRYLWERQHAMTQEGIAYWAYLGGDTMLDTVFLWLLLAAAPVCTLGEKWDRKSILTPGRRIGLALIAVGAEIILAYAQYLASSEVGGAMTGMQTRYFIPVWSAMALALMWPQALRKRMGKFGDWMTAGVFLACAGLNIWNLINHLNAMNLM